VVADIHSFRNELPLLVRHCKNLRGNAAKVILRLVLGRKHSWGS
jgi:hypothetical protein